MFFHPFKDSEAVNSLQGGKLTTDLSIDTGSLKQHTLCLVVLITDPASIRGLIAQIFLLSLCGDEISYESSTRCELLPPVG